jgi:type II secretory pathway pseudopilin PulG
VVTHGQDGLTYLGVLFAIAILGTALAATGMVWRTARQQENEKELLFVGNEFRKAIESYYMRSPGGGQQYPPSLEALIQDPRFPTIERHLRRLYRDPITDRSEWGLVRAPEGGIAGVFSLSEQRPMKQANFSKRDEGFAGANKYSNWQFVFVPGMAGTAGTPPGAIPAPPGMAPGVTLVPPPATGAPPSSTEPAPQVPPITR